jgi:hypothetical protein
MYQIKGIDAKSEKITFERGGFQEARGGSIGGTGSRGLKQDFYIENGTLSSISKLNDNSTPHLASSTPHSALLHRCSHNPSPTPDFLTTPAAPPSSVRGARRAS